MSAEKEQKGSVRGEKRDIMGRRQGRGKSQGRTLLVMGKRHRMLRREEEKEGKVGKRKGMTTGCQRKQGWRCEEETLMPMGRR